ncbi:probable membrane-associated kinase regulator 6 [Hibiscus syriacus]|uniref:probable membrane-associated kinase regulator 6 n=1 Tax=Hibiscus syriacus TaxID=106335 RepID=UPI001920F3FD|nr:probable membrane-associated kinase regulator 6 [Hibiscus syriacus]
METSQSLATDSFSYSWLSDRKPSLDGLHEDSFSNCCEDSNRFLIDHNFKFESIAPTPQPFVHADELFTNGFIRPAYIDPSKGDSCTTLDSIETPPFSSRTDRIPMEGRIHCSFLGKYRRSTKKMLRNLFENLRPLCHKLGCFRKSTGVDDIERSIMWRTKSRNGAPLGSTQRITACSTSMGGDSCYLENPIYEAVLHCKRSIGK